MSEPKFFQTRMGHRFYEHTMPELVKQLERLNELLEQVASRVHTQNEADENTRDA